MTSKREKGNKFVNEAKELFEKAGFIVWKPGMKAVFIAPGKVISSSQDIFECYDLVATSINNIIWIQVKSNESHSSEARTKIDELPMPNDTVRLVIMRVPKKRYLFRAWLKQTKEGWTKPFEISMDNPINICQYRNRMI
jgi:hypothetical protein